MSALILYVAQLLGFLVMSIVAVFGAFVMVVLTALIVRALHDAWKPVP